MKVEKWNRSRLNRFLPILRQLQKKDFQSELTKIFKNSSSAKVIEFLEEIIPKGFIEKFSTRNYENALIEIAIQFKDVNLEFVVSKRIFSSDNILINLYFSKLGRNSGKIELDEFLGFFFLPIVTDWSPTEIDSEREFVTLLRKLENIELRKELDTYNIVDFEKMEQVVRDHFELNNYSNYKFKFKNIFLEDDGSGSENLFLKVTFCSKENISLITIPMYFKRGNKTLDTFKIVDVYSSKYGTLKVNFVEHFLETATYWYRFN